ncbi:MAG TPA: YwqG family protein [Leptospiraceae bacterium]|nr:YwqG family protein [Leptospiraceae bacterium]HNF14483.1 YwqG family protein [Leptospiraceae bacterium]HNF24521.1 YwqG family protein [Leptospiraceae bacterium]HNI94842.1 YwqG family protein [Leptospiraceae bacterium]HNM03262.1 YwqG family protein [Leptospiraceae bacterium]
MDAKISSTLKLSVSVELKGKPSHPWSSKIGGHPYLPVGTEYPSVKKVRPLFLLAQINFEEMPSLPDFPEIGILQFFIGDNELYGLDLESPFKSDYKIVYYPEVIQDKKKLVSDFSFLPEFTYTPLDAGFEAGMRFRRNAVSMPCNDYRFEDMFPELSDDYDLCDEYQEFCGALGTKIGGYPDFTQEDPRVRKTLKGYELLFQLDSEGEVCWGDMGVGNFFIKPEDLKKKDFSKVLYNWDCT